uniref:Acyl-coenzyme A thioesterase 13 n=1 Tax=Plectus sambesii TaxID=2011161 RepID=A0A914V2M9_9BILA
MSSSKYLPFIKEVYKAMSKVDNFQRVANKCRVVNVEEGRCVVEFEVAEEHENPHGTLHGGLTATLVDIVTTSALLATERGHPGVSTDLGVSYLAAAKTGETVVVDAKVLKMGKTLAFTTADLYRKSDNTMIATGRHTKAFPAGMAGGKKTK